MSNRERFQETLKDQYVVLFRTHPEEHELAAKIHTPETLAERFTLLLGYGRVSKDSEGIRRACKALGIEHTNQSIEAYFDADVEEK